ncbi:hypothetical protein DFH08DRAFT_897024 [Mycena albidolilacea]|uniref:BTB domain-containing protein n=1 Tax=Mycena albidolilacea TaxID=1033008 RepID=A0AAD6Z8X9_9AGAR|nr:hypothetical protein DFH08DRAFT_897024 [Mycena albidolilacea]
MVTSTSPKFNSSSADIVFKSSDGVLFHVHRKNLEVCTEGFPPSNISTQGEVVKLTETSVTLELLFQFIYPQRHPALDTTPFEILGPLAEASEKYQVFPAMNICHIRLRDMVNEHPVEVAVYAAKHDYPYLVSQVAPMMISMDPVKVVESLPPYLVIPWIRYVQAWTKVHQAALVLQYGGRNHETRKPCDGAQWPFFALGCMSRLAPGIHTIRMLDRVFDVSKEKISTREPNPFGNPRPTITEMPQCCKTDLEVWRKRIEEGITRIPKFSTFL